MKSLLALSFLSILSVGAAFAQPAPPPQPTFGPGGSAYPHASVVKNGPYWANNRVFDNDFEYFIYEPASPTPANAPVILFLHGFEAFQPKSYEAWAEHMARNGFIVVWVQFQAKTLTPLKTLAPNAHAAWVDALYRLQNFWWEKHVKPSKDASGNLQTTIVGHSVGGWIGAILAAQAQTVVPTIPVPLALTLVEPATKGLIAGAAFGQINPATKMQVLIGDQDTIGCKAQALQIWAATSQLQTRDFLLVTSDTHGSPNQLANHFYPNTDGYGDTAAIDARDFYITWKLSVAAASCVTNGNYCDSAFGGQANELDRGTWSDNVAIAPLVDVADPTKLPPITGCK